MENIRNRVSFYLQSTTLHGLRYVADSKRHPIVRAIWVVVFVISTFFMFQNFYSSYQAYKHNSISFVTETTYLEWDTNFPAVTVCETSSSEIFWTPEPGEDYSPVQQFISDIIFFIGSCYSCSVPCEECEQLDFLEITKRFRKHCNAMLKTCKWNNITFNCCDKFLPLNTEYGVCFSINSLHTKKVPGSELNMFSNRKTGPGVLVIEAIDDLRMYYHATEDVPFINSNSDQRRDVAVGEIYSAAINIIEIANDERIKDVSVEKRGCRFPWENTDNIVVHKYYSYSTCVVQCHADAHFELCNCTHHLMPVLNKKKGFCDLEGLQCLTDNFETLNRLHAAGFSKPGLVCNCVPSCVEAEYSIVTEHRGLKSGPSEIILKMHGLPTFRFKRNLVRSTMDLVVSIGGTAGLFIGASLLNIIEWPYLMFLRR